MNFFRFLSPSMTVNWIYLGWWTEKIHPNTSISSINLKTTLITQRKTCEMTEQHRMWSGEVLNWLLNLSLIPSHRWEDYSSLTVTITMPFSSFCLHMKEVIITSSTSEQTFQSAKLQTRQLPALTAGGKNRIKWPLFGEQCCTLKWDQDWLKSSSFN